MEFTDQNIQDLYKFTRQHFVEHYDVQTELVDHLANDIEEICKEHPKLTFEQARDKSFKKFGIFGFMDVVEQKETQMQRKYFKLILQFVKEWFELPKIILTFLLLSVFYYLQQFQHAYTIYVTVYFAIILAESIFMFLSQKKLKQKEKKTNKKWMLEDIILKQGIGTLILILFYGFDFAMPHSKEFFEMSEFRRVLAASIIVLTIIIGYVTVYVIPKKSEELLEKHYPEYKLA